ncbi:MAG: hypothetical protein ACOYJP_09785 [Oscillospiraceae bacterium]|jgi:hypothetical protein
MKRFFCHDGKEKTGVLPNIASQLRQNVVAYFALIFKGLHRILLRFFRPGVPLYRFAKIKAFPCAKSLKHNGGFGMMDVNKP